MQTFYTAHTRNITQERGNNNEVRSVSRSSATSPRLLYRVQSPLIRPAYTSTSRFAILPKPCQVNEYGNTGTESTVCTKHMKLTQASCMYLAWLAGSSLPFLAPHHQGTVVTSARLTTYCVVTSETMSHSRTSAPFVNVVRAIALCISNQSLNDVATAATVNELSTTTNCPPPRTRPLPCRQHALDRFSVARARQLNDPR